MGSVWQLKRHRETGRKEPNHWSRPSWQERTLTRQMSTAHDISNGWWRGDSALLSAYWLQRFWIGFLSPTSGGSQTPLTPRIWRLRRSFLGTCIHDVHINSTQAPTQCRSLFEGKIDTSNVYHRLESTTVLLCSGKTAQLQCYFQQGSSEAR